jgi:hypothetical protein
MKQREYYFIQRILKGNLDDWNYYRFFPSVWVVCFVELKEIFLTFYTDSSLMQIFGIWKYVRIFPRVHNRFGENLKMWEY